MPVSSSDLGPRRSGHPNDLDRKRIERALGRRARYRYVSPRVLPEATGYRIESPCCSRNIDADGGVIDVALIEYDDSDRTWSLYRKDHHAGNWELYSRHSRLAELLDHLNIDPERKIWQ
ncbi:MAG: DUF3024 domain-containing protein [Beijerinckiaceae bacterium]|nr:DUF3024 domain-containing protein [Beijerinckiaceae bacterium]